MTTDTNLLLAAELARIVKSPYPTQLKTFHDLVFSASSNEISLLAKCYACHVSSLACILVEALPHWPYVLDIITRLSCVIEFRDAFLQAEPSLLNHVVTKAADMQAANGNYVEASIAMLSHPLPDMVAIPAASQALLIRLLEKAAAAPEASNIKPLYRLLYGASRTLVGILPLDLLATMQGHLFTILRNCHGVEDQSLALYCLSMMRIIVDQFGAASNPTPTNQWDDIESSTSSLQLTESLWRPDEIVRFFNGPKAHRTLQVITIGVIWACAAGTEKMHPEASLVSVVLANDILKGISSDVRIEWCTKNAPFVRKLQDRCLVPDLSAGLRFYGLTFLATLAENVTFKPEALSLYERSLLEFGGRLFTDDHFIDSLKLSFPRVAPTFRNKWWQAFVSRVLDMLLGFNPSDLLRSADSLISLLDSISDAAADNSNCRAGVLLAISDPEVRRKMDRFLHTSLAKPISMEGEVCCAKTLTTWQKDLACSFCTLLLRCGLTANATEPQLPGDMIPFLLDKHATRDAYTSERSACSAMSKRPSQPPFVEVQSTPDIGNLHMPWRERLAAKMHIHSESNQQVVLAAVAEICRDLEERCQGVEAPLQQEREKLVDLQLRYDQLGQAYSDMEARVMDRDLRINALEAENDHHNQRLDAVETEEQDLLRRVDKATRDLEKSKEDALNALALAKQERHDLELEHASEIACKQEVLDQSKEDLFLAKEELNELRFELEKVAEKDRESSAQCENMRVKMRELEQGIQEKQQELCRAEQERQSITTELKSLGQEHNRIQDENVLSLRQIEALQLETEDLKAQSKQELEKMSLSFQETLSNIKQQWLGIKNELEQQLEQAREELTAAERGLRQQHDANKQKTSELRRRIDRLTKDCAIKDAQVAEAQEMRNRLMNAMGLAGGLPAIPAASSEPAIRSSTLPYRSTSTIATPKASSQHIPSTPAYEDDEASIIDDAESDDSVVSDISSDHGPTPKRARPRQSIGKFDMQQRFSIGPRSAKSVLRTRSAVKRQPLLDLDANRSPAKTPGRVAFQTAEKQRPHLSTAEQRDVEDWSMFSAGDVLTGTPGIGLKDGMGGVMEEDSTVDV